MRLLEGIFDGSGKRCLGMDETKKPPEMSLYLSVLKATHLHKETAAGLTLSIPRQSEDTGHVRPAMMRIQTILEEASSKRVQLSEIFSDLRRPPYGIRDGLIPVLFSVFSVVNEQHLAFYDNGIFMRRMAGLDVMRFVKNPEMFEVQYCKMSGVKASVFERLLRVFSSCPQPGTALLTSLILSDRCVYLRPSFLNLLNAQDSSHHTHYPFEMRFLKRANRQRCFLLISQMLAAFEVLAMDIGHRVKSTNLSLRLRGQLKSFVSHSRNYENA